MQPSARDRLLPRTPCNPGRDAAFLVRTPDLTDDDPGIDFTDDNGSIFGTDSSLAAVDPLATRQFAEPGFHLASKMNVTASRIDCSAKDPWPFAYTFYQIGRAGNREHLPHIPDMNLEYSLRRN